MAWFWINIMRNEIKVKMNIYNAILGELELLRYRRRILVKTVRRWLRSNGFVVRQYY
jgi:hypothetical protein